MWPEIEQFARWLRCQSLNAATHRHYASDLKLFFAWADKRPDAITFRDIDAYVIHCREIGHAGATVNRRLAALRAFYRFLDLESGSATANRSAAFLGGWLGSRTASAHMAEWHLT